MPKKDTPTKADLKNRAKSSIQVSGISIAASIILAQLFFQFFNKGPWAGLLTFIFAFPLFVTGVVLLAISLINGVKALFTKNK